MSATLAALPNTRHLFIPRRTPMERAVLLAWLAAEETENPGHLPCPVVALCLAALAAETLAGDTLADAWASYLSAVREERDTGDGMWAGVPDDFARCNAKAALEFLVHGEAR